MAPIEIAGKTVAMDDLLWSPPADAWETSRLGRFASRVCAPAVGDYEALWRWSVENTEAFWREVWDEFDVLSDAPVTEVLGMDDAGKASWFAGTSINYAEHVLRGNGLADDDVAVISASQTRADQQLTMQELREQVRRAAAALRTMGVGPGDRVGAYLPNVPETLVAFLATASLGAIWSSCAPEFGVRAVLDRWTQIEPKVILTIDGYRYGSKEVDLHTSVAAIRAELPSVTHTVVLGYLNADHQIPDAVSWDAMVAPCDDDLTFARMPFDHPLYILYSSGTTGLPKAIVHGHGGVLLEHAKQIGLQMDLGPGDRFFWFSTTGWMMWNFLVSGLLVGSSIVLFDGNPGDPDLNVIWRLVADTDATFAGVSAPFIVACQKAGLEPGVDFDLSKVAGLGSTGAPLPAAGFRWAHEHVAPVQLASISGGTDVCSAFLGSSPVTPVVAGVIPCRQLGWSIFAFSPGAQPLWGEQGELVITKPAPSMPVGFWGDDGTRYHDAYYSTYSGVWRHGDWITIEADGSSVVSGRSDATLNRGGVRLGTADFYTVVESDPAVADSLVVHLEDDQGGLGELLVFVVVDDNASIDDEARKRLVSLLRAELSPRHAPDQIVVMPVIPRTLSGKKLEIPVKRILQGVSPEKAAAKGALADPKALDHYVAFAAERLDQ